MHSAVDDAGREAGDRSARAHAKVAVEQARAGVGDRAPGQDGEAAGRPETHWRHRGAGGRLREDEHGYGRDEHERRAQPGVASIPALESTAEISHLSSLPPSAR
jgi:hypothetical protein